MRRLALIPIVVITAFAVAACSNTSSSPAASAPAASAAGGGGGGAACATGEGTATVAVEIKDFKFNPDPVTAKVGDVIGWTNGDSTQHTATLDDGSCDTGSLSQGATGLLVFSAAGTYPYKCKIHPTQMTGTITISE
jgi:plastocyanin